LILVLQYLLNISIIFIEEKLFNGENFFFDKNNEAYIILIAIKMTNMVIIKQHISNLSYLNI